MVANPILVIHFKIMNILLYTSPIGCLNSQTLVSFIPPEGFKFQVYYLGDSDFKAHRGVYSMHMYCFQNQLVLQMNGGVDYTPQVPPQGCIFHAQVLFLRDKWSPNEWRSRLYPPSTPTTICMWACIGIVSQRQMVPK